MSRYPAPVPARRPERLVASAFALALACHEPDPYDGLVFNEFEATVDYFELANAGSNRLDLGGLRLTDDGEDAAPRLEVATTIPEGTRLGPGEVLLVLANLDEAAKPGWRTECGGHAERCLHASFGISRDSGERFYVVAPGGDVVLRGGYPARPVADGLSWGRLPDAIGAFGANRPTPGAHNRPPWTPEALARQRREAEAAAMPAPVERGPSEKQIARELLDRSGLSQQFTIFQDAIAEKLRERGEALDPAVLEALVGAADAAFSPNRLRAAAEARLAARLEPSHVEDALAWLRSSRGRKVTGVEEAANTLTGAEGIRALAERLAEEPPDPGRLALCRRIDAAAGATRVSAEVLVEREMAIATALAAADPEHEGAAEVRRGLSAQRDSLIRHVANSTLVALLYTYRDLPAEDLDAYAEFLESAAGRWYAASAQSAVTGALSAARANLGIALGEAFSEFGAAGEEPPRASSDAS